MYSRHKRLADLWLRGFYFTHWLTKHKIIIVINSIKCSLMIFLVQDNIHSTHIWFDCACVCVRNSGLLQQIHVFCIMISISIIIAIAMLHLECDQTKEDIWHTISRMLQLSLLLLLPLHSYSVKIKKCEISYVYNVVDNMVFLQPQQ